MIGRLRDRISLQTETLVDQAGGSKTKTWATTATVWAQIKPLRGGELYHAQQLSARVTHRIVIRRRTDVTPTAKMRVLFGTRVFNIHSVINRDERNRWIELMAEEGVAV